MTLRQNFVALAAIVTAIGLAPLSQASAETRQVQNLDKTWQFIQAAASANLTALPDAMSWQDVTLPFTYNARDGSKGGGYYRGPAWYKTTFAFTDDRASHRTYIEFDGAATVADVWINGVSAGRHVGGYARFRFDITNLLKTGTNTVSVRTSNARTDKAPPIGGDFTVFGGLYRNVRLVTTSNVHFDMMDAGGPGVYFTADKVLSKAAQLTSVARISNDANAAAKVEVRISLVDAEGKSVRKEVADTTVNPGATVPVTVIMKALAPHLWDGVRDPYLYTVRAELIDETNGKPTPLDEVDQSFGFRDIRLDGAKGLILNGRETRLHGVALFHSSRPDKGLAVSDADIDQDLQILREMGANGLRLVHFQHPPHTYDQADRLGFLLWTEIPVNGIIDPGQDFSTNAQQQLRELIRQNYNHPSVMVWGLGNEIYKSDADSNRLLDQLQAEAHADDATRPTVYANCCSAPDAPHARHTDTIGFNIYNGWYPEQKGTMGDWIDNARAIVKDKPFAISEYGAGASVLQQEDPPAQPTPASYWHPEQYQALFHETSWRQLRDKTYLWGTFVWAGFDVASDGRHEGDRDGINDKGLVTYDRSTRKDAYYWYQANWTDKPMIHITSARFSPRPTSPITVKIYSNLDKVALTVNGVKLPDAPVIDHIAKWTGVALTPGDNAVVASDASSGSTAQDRVTWTFSPTSEPAPTKLQGQ